jgi:hypothetical protein
MPSNWEYIDGVGAVLGVVNQSLEPPVWESELRHIVKSVIKISRENLASGQTQRGPKAIQAERGRRGGRNRRQRTAGRDAAIVQAVLGG